MSRINTSRRTTSQAGLTLIEVIIAISVLAVMVSINYKILTGIVKAKAILDDRREAMFIANSLLTRISRELQLVVRKPLLPSCDSANEQPPTGAVEQANPSDQGQTRPSSSGKPVLLGASSIAGNSITFMAREAGQYIPDGGTHSGIVQITYRVAEDPEPRNDGSRGLLLIRDEVPHTKPLTKACKGVLRFPITNNLVSLEFQYFDDKAGEWSSSWDGERSARLPRIIQFTVGLRSPAGELRQYTSSIFVSATS